MPTPSPGGKNRHAWGMRTIVLEVKTAVNFTRGTVSADLFRGSAPAVRIEACVRCCWKKMPGRLGIPALGRGPGLGLVAWKLPDKQDTGCRVPRSKLTANPNGV